MPPLTGSIYFEDFYAGELKQEPDGRCVFTYDKAYLEAYRPHIAFTLPRSGDPYTSEAGLHPFFDNLVAEGWLRNAQARAIRIAPEDRFALLLAFGHDCAGAVSVRTPYQGEQPDIEVGDPAVVAALTSRASLSGVQPKVLAVRDGNRFRPARRDETSLFIAKLPSGALRDIIENEFITTETTRALLPDDRIANLEIASVDGIAGRALLVERFDRLRSGARIHFEEFNQLLGRRSGDKYNARYDDMAAFILTTPGCTPVDAWRLYQRELVYFLTGNTDAHLKNFAMFHTTDGLRLAPAYDLVAVALYPEYSTVALALGEARDLQIDAIRPKHLVALGQAHGLAADEISYVVNRLDARRDAANKAAKVAAARAGAEQLGDALLNLMERRWNGSFASIGQFLSKKPSDAVGR